MIGAAMAHRGGPARGAQQQQEADSDEDDYVFYGTRLGDEADPATAPPAGCKADPSAQRSLPVHEQVATDEQGRRRFHGAFTGGFSAGYFNTVGSKVSLFGGGARLVWQLTAACRTHSTHLCPAARPSAHHTRFGNHQRNPPAHCEPHNPSGGLAAGRLQQQQVGASAAQGAGGRGLFGRGRAR